MHCRYGSPFHKADVLKRTRRPVTLVERFSPDPPFILPATLVSLAE